MKVVRRLLEGIASHCQSFSVSEEFEQYGMCCAADCDGYRWYILMLTDCVCCDQSIGQEEAFY